MTESLHRIRHHAPGDLDTWFPVDFYERILVSPDGMHRYRYEDLDVRYDQFGTGRGYPMNFPPAVGDWIVLAVHPPEASGSFRVIDRQWQPSFYGSTYWPVGEPKPVVPHHLTLILERSNGPFLLEAEPEEEEEEES